MIWYSFVPFYAFVFKNLFGSCIKDRGGIQIFIIALSFNDLLISMILLIRNSMQVAGSIVNPSPAWSAATFILALSLMVNQYLLAMIALDRYLAICHPLSYKLTKRQQVSEKTSGVNN